MKRLSETLRALGATGVVGLGVLFFCIPFYFSTLRPAELELAAHAESALKLRARGPYQPIATDRRTEELRRFHGLFPSIGTLTDELDRVYALAREANLELTQGEYRLEPRAAGPVAYRIALPVRGTYAQIRSFVASVLKEMPIASVDGLRFERKKAVETQLDAQVRLTIHFRPREHAGGGNP